MEFARLYLVLIILIVLAVGCILVMKFQKPRKPTNVLKFPKRSGKSRQIPKQACSYCKKKAPALSFYSDQGNKVIGVCRECKPQAERLGLLRL